VQQEECALDEVTTVTFELAATVLRWLLLSRLMLLHQRGRGRLRQRRVRLQRSAPAHERVCWKCRQPTDDVRSSNSRRALRSDASCAASRSVAVAVVASTASSERSRRSSPVEGPPPLLLECDLCAECRIARCHCGCTARLSDSRAPKRARVSPLQCSAVLACRHCDSRRLLRCVTLVAQRSVYLPPSLLGCVFLAL
jgi:hypothetical protein